MKIPKGWHEVTISDYLKMLANYADTSLSSYDLMVSNISVLCHADYAEVEAMPIKRTAEIARQLEFIATQPTKFINEVIIGDKLYKVQPDLSAMTYGQFKALSHYTSDKDKVNDNLPQIMALFVYEKGKPYEEGYKERCELFREKMTMDVVFPLSAFFFELLKRFVKTTAAYSMERAEKMLKEIEQEIQEFQQTESLTSVSGGSM